jgi:NDP-sugar pyrophosphorylase family protein
MEDVSHITAGILAGGLGTRLRPVMADRPKVLAEVRGRPFLEYLFDQLVDAGIQDVVLCTGYLGEQIEQRYEASYKRLRLTYSQETSPKGTGGALRLAMPCFKSALVLVMNGDSFCQVNFQQFYAWYCEQHAASALVITRVADVQRYGNVSVDPDGCVLSFEEKGSKSGSGWINAGIYLLSRRLIEEIPEHESVSLERNIFPCWIGRRLYAYRSEGRFLDIGTPESYCQAEEFFDSEERT